MHLVKYHALGNDFLIFLDLDDRQPVGGDQARALCDRHRGVGGDGLIRLTIGPDGQAHMELFNADGGRAETSGNGLRCMVRALADAGLVPKGESTVVTDAGPRRAWLHDDGTVTVEMGTVIVSDGGLRPGRPGLAGEAGKGRRAAAVDVGNPHVVVEVDDPMALDLEAEARPYPGRNVELVAPGPGPGALTMRVWERGVGETTSCGSGSVAVAAAARHWGTPTTGEGRPVVVHQPGGELSVRFDGGTALLTGPATYVAAISVP